ncbi:MAG TPA: AarF/ABC1/UbiB kinase family protein [Ktedonobacteraceae bacterium]|nr:AarF/ABC1/UbiB kinase family protein [Ktedonobacteraceae bacterium]
MLESKTKRRRKLPWWQQWWRAWSVFRLLIWTIWVIYRERRRVIRARERGDYNVQPNIEVLIKVLTAFRQTAIKLGVLMIKLGQFLSSRADLLPEQALATLQALQDEVPPAPFSHVVSMLEAELGKPVEQIFSVLERKATAAASLGQVHKATLAVTGEKVAVKVQRPNIDQLVRTDLSTLKFVIRLITRFFDTSKFIDLMAVYREFERTVHEEIDFVTEAANAKRFKEMFKDDPTIYIPGVFDEYVSRRVLVLEWIDGIKINDYASLEAEGIDRMEVAKRTVQTYFHQFFDEGFFHADPHPGNIFVKKGQPGAGPIIEFVDFGMVGHLTKTMKKAMKDLFLSFMLRDSHTMVEALRSLGFIGEGANIELIEHGLNLMLQQFYGMTLGEARDLEIPEVTEDVGKLLYGQPFQIPAQFAYTGRAVGTLVGVATGLAPDFNFVDVATPYARKFVGLDTEHIGQTLQQLLSQLLETVTVLLKLPRSLERILAKLETGQLEIRIGGDIGLGSSRGRLRRSDNAASANAFSLALTFVAALAGSYLFTYTHNLVLIWFCLILAAILGLRLMLRR